MKLKQRIIMYLAGNDTYIINANADLKAGEYANINLLGKSNVDVYNGALSIPKYHLHIGVAGTVKFIKDPIAYAAGTLFQCNEVYTS